MVILEIKLFRHLNREINYVIFQTNQRVELFTGPFPKLVSVSLCTNRENRKGPTVTLFTRHLTGPKVPYQHLLMYE